MEEIKHLVYGLCDPDTKEIRYIGKSSTGMTRPNEHVKNYSLKDKTYKNNWIKSLIKNGKEPEIKVLRYCLSEDDAFYSEIEFIKYHVGIGTKLTNSTDGGPGGDTGGGQKRRIAVIATNMVNKTKKRYEYVTETIKDGFSPTKVVAVCKGKRLSHLGYYFHYENNPIVKRESKTTKIVKIINIETQEEFIFDSIRKAAIYLKVSPATIQNYCSGKTKNKKFNVLFGSIEENIKVKRAENLYSEKTMFSETKSLKEWFDDPRCKVNYKQYRKRIGQGWNPEDALTRSMFDRKAKIGEESHNSKLNNEIIYLIRHMSDNGDSYAKISRELNVSLSNVTGIAKRQRWSHLPEKPFDIEV